MADSDIIIGFQVPEGMDDALRLQAASQNIAKSVLLRDVITKHVEDNNWTIPALIQRHVQYLYSQWDLRWRDNESFEEYLQRVQIDLRQKAKLPDRLITPIIEQCEELHQQAQSGKK